MSNKVPQIRFNGYSDPWVQRKFGELYKKVTEKNDLSFGKDKIISVANMYFKTDESRSDDAYMRTYNIFRVGDIAFEGHSSKKFAYGRFVENTIGDGIVSHIFDVFRPISNYDLQYWKYAIINEQIMGRILMTSTTQSTMMNNLVSKDFLKRQLAVPTYEEQAKIGAFLESLDKLIAANQRKLELLKEQKKGYLQKMFPKNGAKVPELRFAGFADDWEERKLGDLGSVAMNKRIFKEQTSDVGDIPFYKIGTFGGTPDAFISRDIFEEYKSKYQYPEVGDILISASGSIGRTVVYRGDDEYFQDSNIVWLKHDQQLDNSFLKQFYSIVKWKGLEGSTIKRLYNKNILETKITLPSPEEQAQLGSFFQQLDNTIDLHQRKLDLLKEQKKGFLQKMFV